LIFKRTRTYLIDENVKISSIDIQKIKKSNIINSTDIFRKGERDEKLTAMAKDKGWVIVTRDVRMALRSLIDGVPIIFINDDYKTVSYVTSKTHGKKKYPDMFEYIREKLGCE
tara:strand:+ start:2069 stop:2407 length:339 start_codon:yes stop_codon:yes gene_type:complete